MKILFSAILLVSVLFTGMGTYGQNKTPVLIKVACIGNSVTYGAGLKDPARESYPVLLQSLLGASYQVGNYGRSGATLLKKGHNPYFKTPEFKAALALKPDIAVIHLGLNDTDPRNWPEHRDEFEADYSWLLDTFRKENPRVKLFISRITPIFSGHPRFTSGTRDWYWQIQELIPGIARSNGARLIDLNTPLHNRPDLFADNLHPDKEGAAIIARIIYQAISGDYGGLKPAKIFGDFMVLQRDQAISIYGKANAAEKIRVSFAGQTTNMVTDTEGNWKVNFPALPAGGPHQLEISAKSGSYLFSEILMGDVWLASGQSNMAFELKNALGSAAEISNAANNQLRLLKYRSLRETDNTEWDSTALVKTNQLQFFSGSWQKSGGPAAADFSAIAYLFGKKIQMSEGVPIGLIEMAVGGSGIESWIDRYTLEHNYELVGMISGWRKSDFIMPWVRERADKNLKLATSAKQRHPYEPSYNYEAGISAIIGSPIKGVIWYQGESNAHNPELYQSEFRALTESWRKSWKTELPFYYVQLSSINRPSWPQFRSMQSKLQQQIPNVAMAVSTDLGDSLDVHPKRKKEVAHRLALLALKNTYGRDVRASGPVPITVEAVKDEIAVTFRQAEKLSTSDKGKLTGFELVSDRGFVIPVTGSIRGTVVFLKIPHDVKVKTVRYAWQPFTRANLVNEAGLPASTFVLDVLEEAGG